MSTPDINSFKESICSCNICKSMCKNPCIPTPDEAMNLMNLGYNLDSRFFYLQHEDYNYDDVEVLLPYKNLDTCACEFQNNEGLCELHDKGLKPLEGRLALHGVNYEDSSHEVILSLWLTDKGKKVIEARISK